MWRFFSMWFYPLAAAALLATGLRNGAAVPVGAAFAAGLFAWTLLEYLVHRWVLHVPLPTWLAAGHGHGGHHQRPNDRDRILVRPLAGLVVALAAAGLIASVMPDLATATGLLAGLSLGFAAYETIHWGLHTRRWKQGLGGLLRRYHYRHHFRDPGRCFGVTTPLWDWLLGTGPRS